ncbi:S16 family serine protease [Lentzea sp. NPDC058436]|uniref:S16 family serine protease n=1 Tax=Lentzea sp. NPDC058436 TaxID=3346499 RepID=UPI003655F12E
MSALSTLDELLAQAGRGDPHALTPDQLRARLSTGLLWWQAVREAVTEAPRRLVDWERGTDRRVAGEVGDRDFLEATRVTAAVGLVLAAASGEHAKSEGVEAIIASTRRWQERGLLVETRGAHRWRANDGLRLVDALPEGPGRSLAHIAVALMSGIARPRAFRHRIGVLFDTGERRGATGSLKLAVVPGGPPGLFPDPRTMTFLRVDGDFTASLQAAWDFVSHGRKKLPCVLWEIDPGDCRLGPINGPSLGAAFAVALTGALSRVDAGFLKGWRGRSAVTGAVTARGEVGGVHGLEAKFEAARDAKWEVVAPEENQENAPSTTGLHVHWVSTVDQARARTRSWRPGRLAVVAVVVALVVTSGVVLWQRSVFRQQQDESLKQRAVSELLREASAMRDSRPQQALRLVLSANGLEDSGRVRAALLAALTNRREPETLFTGFGEVRSTQFTKDGYVLLAGDRGAVIWQVASPTSATEVAFLPGEDDDQAVRDVTMNTDGTVALLDRVRGPLEIWDVRDKKTPRLTGKMTGLPCDPVARSLSQTGHRLLTGCANGTITLWDLSSGSNPIKIADLLPKPPSLTDVALNPDGNSAFVTTADGLLTWQEGPDGVGMRRRDPDPSPQSEPETSARVIAVGRFVSASGSAEGGVILRVSGEKSQESLRLSFTDQDEITSVATNDTLVLSGVETGEAILWAATEPGVYDYRPKLLLHGHDDAVTAVALSWDGTAALTASRDGSAKLWDIRRPSPFSLAGASPLDAPVDQVVASQANSLALVITERGEASLWDLTDTTHPKRRSGVKSHRAAVRSAAMDPGRAQVATGADDGTVQLTDISTADDLRKLSEFEVSGAAVRALAFHPAGTSVAAGSDDGSVVLGDVGKPTPVPLPRREKDAVRALTFNQSGDLLAIGGASGRVELWRVDPPQLVGKIPKARAGVRALAFDPRGGSLLVTIDSGTSVAQWDVTAPERPAERPSLQFRAGKMRTVAYSRDGTMVIGASTDGTAVVWSVLDPGTPHQMAELTGHTGPVLAAAPVVGGDAVLTGSFDKSVVAWDISDLITINRDPRARACQEARGALPEDQWRRHEQLKHFPHVNACR